MRFVVIAVLLLAGCATGGQPGPRVQTVKVDNAQIMSLEAEGNLRATQPIGCVGISTLTDTHTPADIFPGVRACIEAGEHSVAGELFFLAGVYGRFDMLRVTDQTAHQAIAVLRIENLGPIDPELVSAFQDEAAKLLESGSPEHAGLCKLVKQLGPPAYHPVYMIQHGMGAFFGGGDSIKADFNAAKGWKESLDSYLHCP